MIVLLGPRTSKKTLRNSPKSARDLVQSQVKFFFFSAGADEQTTSVPFSDRFPPFTRSIPNSNSLYHFIFRLVLLLTYLSTFPGHDLPSFRKSVPDPLSLEHSSILMTLFWNRASRSCMSSTRSVSITIAISTNIANHNHDCSGVHIRTKSKYAGVCTRKHFIFVLCSAPFMSSRRSKNAMQQGA